MGRAQKVVDRLDGIEGFDRHLHRAVFQSLGGAVPQSGEFERFQPLPCDDLEEMKPVAGSVCAVRS